MIGKPETRGDESQAESPLPFVPIMYKKPHWKSTIFVTLLVLFTSVLAYSVNGVRGPLLTLLLTTVLTGCYVVLTGRGSWAHVRGGRLMGLTLVAISIFGVIGIQSWAPAQGIEWLQAADQDDEREVSRPKQLHVSAYVPKQPTYEALPESVTPVPEIPPVPEHAEVPEPAPTDNPDEEVTYANCSAVWDTLGRPINIGEPGYHADHDRDADGVGCEEDPR